MATQLCELCNAIAVDQIFREIFQRLKDSRAAGTGGQKESIQIPWQLNLTAVFKSSTVCVFCKLVLQGLRDARRQLVEETRFSGDWYEIPKDFDDDITTIPFYSNGKPNLTIAAWPLDEFEEENTITSVRVIEGKLKAHAIFRVSCGGGIETKSSWDGYDSVTSELRISSKDGKGATNVFFGRSANQCRRD